MESGGEMNLQQLTYFVAVARTRNFTRAAEACFVAQPALSQQVRKLEEELGLPVFERRPQGVALTAAGTAFLEYAENALRLVQQGKQRVADLREVRSGCVTLTCLPTLATYWLPKVIALHRARFPEAEIVIHEKAGSGPDDFQEGQFDLALVQLAHETIKQDPCMRVEKMFVDEQMLVLPHGHRLLTEPAYLRRGIPLRELADEPLVLPGVGCGMMRTIAHAFAEARIHPGARIQTSQIEAIYEMVAAGLGVGIMPAMASHRDYPRVTWRRFADPVPQRTIALVTSSTAAPSFAAAALIKEIRALARSTAENELKPGFARAAS
jgi:LysR family hydrogen peroxide-inducible transcriptional activator